MILTKQIRPPVYTVRTVRRKRVGFFHDEDGKWNFSGASHFLCTEEGAKVGPTGRRVAQLPFTEGKMFACGKALFLTNDEKILRYHAEAGTSLSDGVGEISGAAHAYGEYVDESVYASTQEGVKKIFPKREVVLSSPRLFCIAYFRERLFAAGDYAVYYSDPQNAESFARTQSGGGCLLLPHGEGKILDMVEFEDKLYLFRERGIFEVEVAGDFSDFRVKRRDGMGTTYLSRTAVVGGEKIYFFTQSGLYTFDGGKCRKVKGSGCSFVDETGRCKATFFEGKYYLAASVNGVRNIYVYDPVMETGSYLNIPADEVESMEGKLYANVGDGLYELYGEGIFPTVTDKPYLETDLSYLGFGDGRKRLLAVTLSGKGNFTLTVTNEEGRSVTLSLSAGERKRADLPGRAFRFRICAEESDCLLGGCVLSVAQEEKNGY